MFNFSRRIFTVASPRYRSALYSGEIVFCEKLTTRSIVSNFGESIRGISEIQARGEMDKYEGIRKVKQLLRVKMLVGPSVGHKKHPFTRQSSLGKKRSGA